MRNLKLCVILVTVLFFISTTACGDDDDNDDEAGDDDDEVQKIIDEITAVVEEMTAGQMARTAQAFQEKVFPNISEEYAYAGFDKQQLMDDILEDLEENDQLTYDAYELTVEVDLAENRQSATVATVNTLTATLAADEETNFDAAIHGVFNGEMPFVLEQDGRWRLIGGRASFNQWSGGGGEAGLATDLSGVTVSAQSVGPGGKLTLSGSPVLPEVEAGQSLYLFAAMGWGDDRANAVMWTSEDESVFQEEVTAQAGSTFDLDLTLPGDGQPEGASIPSRLPPGLDGIQVQVGIAVIDEQEEPVRQDIISFTVPFEPLNNGELCEPGPTSNWDGLWRIMVSYQGTDVVLEILDLAVVGDEIYGAAAYAGQDEEGNWLPAVAELTGAIDSDWATFGMETDSFFMEYTARLDGLELLDGTLTIVSDQTTVFDFTGGKIDNRCGGLESDDLESAVLDVDVAGLTGSLDVALDFPEVSLAGVGRLFTGYQFRNLLVAIDMAQTGAWLALAFADDQGGWAAAIEDVEPVEGTFTVR